jgi:arylsulfatase A-like enzyme
MFFWRPKMDQPKKESLNRRQFVKLIAGTAATAAIPISGCRSELLTAKTSTAKPPNIIFLLTDDQRWDTLGCMGNPIIQTPNMDDLAANGVLFTHAFVTTSICASSRASILSGQFVRRHGIAGFATSFSEAALAQTYPLLLRGAGYRIGCVGKHGVGRGGDFPVDKYDVWFGCPGQCSPYERKDKDGNYKHLTQIFGDQIAEFLDGCSKEKPFCLSVNFKAPHVQDSDPRQFIPDRAYKDLYKNVTIPTPKTADPRYFDALPEFLRTSEARRRWNIRFSTPEKFQESVKNYYRLIYGVDVVIGKIRAQLERLNLADNTIIILIGDNGFYLGEHGLAGKWFPHEESIRVPLLVYDPRAPKKLRGLTRDEFALNIDIAPTILQLAGLNPPPQMQGQSLLPLLTGKRTKWRTDFFYEHLFAHKTIPKTEALRTSRFKYARYIDFDYEELYDLKSDPHETQNLAKDQKYRKTLISLRKRCDKLLKAAKGT